MIPAELHLQIGLPGFGGSRAAFACPLEDYHRHYEITQGYFTLSAGKVKHDTDARHCPHDDLPMFLRAFDPGRGVGTWACAQFDCGHEEEDVGCGGGQSDL